MQFLWVFSSPVPIAQMNFFFKIRICLLYVVVIVIIVVEHFPPSPEPQGQFQSKFTQSVFGLRNLILFK